MAHIVVITHEFESPFRQYLLFDVLNLLTRSGHSFSISAGPRPRPGDVGILHVDCTHIAEDYLALGKEFELSINFDVRDISKRRISGAVLTRDSDWAGPIIIKSDLNCRGLPESAQNAIAKSRGRPLPHPGLGVAKKYVVLPSINAVQEKIWNNKNIVVERFIPEPDENGFALRTWVFMGDRERCTRHVSPNAIIKGDNVVSRTPSDVPNAIRAERARLGFDYGKFDFVVHDGVPVLLDANRTPGLAPNLRQFFLAGTTKLAEGLDRLIADPRRR